MIDFTRIKGTGNFYFVRHGESTGNTTRIAQGRADFPLTPKGKEQAARLGRWFADKSVEVILSSPLLRASQTAEIIARETGVEAVQVWEELNEVEIGVFEGLSWPEIGARYPQELRLFRRHSWDAVPGAEKTTGLYERGGAVWELVLGLFQADRRNILAVTHSGLLQWIIKVTLGHKSWLPLFPMGNCSVYQFTLNNRTIPPDEVVADETEAFYYAWELMDWQA